MMKYLLIILPICCSLTMVGQSRVVIDSLVQGVIEQRISKYDLPQSMFDQAAETTLLALRPYFNSNSEDQRRRAYTLTEYAAQVAARQGAYEVASAYLLPILTFAAVDRKLALREAHTKRLLRFEVSTFSEQARQLVINLNREDSLVSKYTLQLLGMLQLKEQIPMLQDILSREDQEWASDRQYTSSTAHVRWGAMLALARLGDSEALETLLQQLERYEDDYIVLELFDDLMYTRSKQALRIFLDYMEGDGRLPPLDHPNEQGQSYGSRAMGWLARGIKDFPFDFVPGFSYSDKIVEAGANWLRANLESLQFDYSKF